jgi:hypothetical protein
MFDSRQAALFDSLDERPPKEVQVNLKKPFPQMYIEFTEPIAVGEQEPGHFDYARAVLLLSDVARFQRPTGDLSIDSISVFLTEGEGEPKSYVDRSFKAFLPTCQPVLQVMNSRLGIDPSELPSEWKDDKYFLAGFEMPEMPNRHIGYWERVSKDYTELVSWILCYLMCKSVVIEPEWISRQQRRWNERHNIIPRPWHIVKLDPKIVSHRTSEETDIHHRYRYDVIGHLRFNKHRVLDGTNDDGSKKYGYHDTIEWVPTHQRGLANELYIPKTYSVEGGKKVAPEMKKYFGTQVKVGG